MSTKCLATLVLLSSLIMGTDSRPNQQGGGRGVITMKMRGRQVNHLANITNKGLQLYDIASNHLFGHEGGLTYETRISLGEPLQTLRVLVSTTKTGLWVPKKGCTNKGENSRFCPNQGTYDLEASKTNKKVKGSFKRDTVQEGIYRKDAMAFGDAKCPKLKLKTPVVFGLGTLMTNGDQGILGLGLPDASSDPKLTHIFDQTVKDGLLDAPVFTTLFKGCAQAGGCKKAGMLTLGGVDSKLCEDVPAWNPLPAGAKSWSNIKVDGVKVNAFKHVMARDATIDPTQSHIHLTQAEWMAVGRQVGGLLAGGVYTVACDKAWDLIFTINGKEYPVSHKHLTKELGKGKCEVLVKNSKAWVLGAPFARAYCIAHNWEKRELGFAKVKSV